MNITGLTFEEATPEALGLCTEDVNSLAKPAKNELKEKNDERRDNEPRK